MSEVFLTEIEVSRKTKISLATLRRWRLENRGPHYRKFGSLVRYPEDELLLWEQSQPHGGDDPARRFDVQPERNGSHLRRAG
jgi:predicted DNA-binding transcriptional regulator AlpA